MDALRQQPSAFEEELDPGARLAEAQPASGMQALNKSTNSLPPFANQSRVSKIKNAVAAAKDDDLERAHDPLMAGGFAQSSPQNVTFLKQSTLSRGSSHAIDAECMKLKESYTLHRQQRTSKSRERSKSGMRANSRSVGRSVLLDASGLGNPLTSLDKENGDNEAVRNSMASSSFQNRYKRN